MSAASHRRLLELFKSRAVSFGTFTLASGKESTYYINSKRALFHSRPQPCLLRRCGKTRDLDIQAVGGLEVGAIPMATALVLRYHQEGRALEGFFVRKQAELHGSQERIEGVLPPGARVAIVDDVLTTGGSALQAVEEVEKAGGKVVVILCIVDRLEVPGSCSQRNTLTGRSSRSGTLGLSRRVDGRWCRRGPHPPSSDPGAEEKSRRLKPSEVPRKGQPPCQPRPRPSSAPRTAPVVISWVECAMT